MKPQLYLTFNPELAQFSSVDGYCSSLSTNTTQAEVMPLQNEWTIWEQIESNATKDYTNNMKAVMKFNTVQDFWRVWKEVPQPSQLMTNHRMVRRADNGDPQFVDAIMIFRDGVKPMWEDPINSSGGHFETRYFITQSKAEQALMDEHWNNLVLGMIGSNIDPVGMITGIRLVDKLHSARGGFLRIEIWFTGFGGLDPKAHFRENLEETMLTRLDGKRMSYNIQWVMKKHNRGSK